MGQIVGSYFNSGVRHGYLLTGGAFTTIDDALGAHATEASGINGTGQIAGYYIDASNTSRSTTSITIRSLASTSWARWA
jgi:hypothetical protein